MKIFFAIACTVSLILCAGCAGPSGGGEPTYSSGKADTTIMVTASSANVMYGAAVSLTATVCCSSATQPSGSVAFASGTTQLGTCVLAANGSCTVSTAVLPIGADGVVATYAGDANFNGSTSATTTISVITSTTSPVATTARNIYVLSQSVAPNAVLAFSTAANGSTTPLATLIIPGSILTAVATDATGNLYVGAALGTSGGEILVYPAGATGTAAPSRTITGPDTSLPFLINSLSVDSTGVIYASYATTYGEVVAFAPGANGNVAPVRTITGPATTLSMGLALAVDSSNNLYVTNVIPFSSIVEFPSNANGNVAPSRTISGSATGLSYGEQSLAIDSAGNIYATSNGSGPAILEFAATASGNAAPIRTLQGQTGAYFYEGLALDSSGNIFVETYNNTGAYSVNIFPPTSSGAAAPAAFITSTAWSDPGQQIALH